MTVFKKLQAARHQLLNSGIEKSGHNKFSNYHYFELGDAMPVYFRPQDVYVFDSAGMLALAPMREGVH